MKKENFIWSSIKVGLIAGAVGIFLSWSAWSKSSTNAM
jgi:hypothetical protein